MKKILLIIVLLPFALNHFAQQKGFDFRNTRWGMTVGEVKKYEKAPFIGEENGYIMYKGSLNDWDVTIYYWFTDKRLIRGSYFFNRPHTNMNLYIDDFENMKPLLTQKYGAPETDEILWSDNKYKNQKDKWGLAISLGHVRYHTAWRTKTSKIAMHLQGDNSEMAHYISYYDLKDLAKSNKKNLEGL